MAGIPIVCSPPNMAPYGAKDEGVHNSPIAIAVPTKRHRSVVLDMATSLAAGGKLTLAAGKGVPLGEGWALSGDGNPTTDPNLAKILVPSGGPKGSGLAFMFQCLTSLMAGNPLLAPVLRGGENPRTQNSVVAAIDIGVFTDVVAYGENVDALTDCLKTLPTSAGFGEIFVPGQPEDRTCDDRAQNGIPLPPGTVHKLRGSVERFGIDLPEGV